MRFVQHPDVANIRVPNGILFPALGKPLPSPQPALKPRRKGSKSLRRNNRPTLGAQVLNTLGLGRRRR